MEPSPETPTDGGSVERNAPRSPNSSSERSPKAVVYLQDACFEHRFIRSEVSGHPEHPKRLRAVRLGVAAAIARLEELANRTSAAVSTASATSNTGDDAKEDDLAAAISRMNLVSDSIVPKDLFVPVVKSAASVNMLRDSAMELIHDKLYLKDLAVWIGKSSEMIDKGFSEIPNGLSQGDLFRLLYLTSLPVV
jgi:histone deacetylase HOS3